MRKYNKYKCTFEKLWNTIIINFKIFIFCVFYVVKWSHNSSILISVIFLLFHLPKNFRCVVAKAIKHRFRSLFLKNLRRRRENLKVFCTLFMILHYNFQVFHWNFSKFLVMQPKIPIYLPKIFDPGQKKSSPT